MLWEIMQIREWVARHHGLGYVDGRVIGDVPDGSHVIPLGSAHYRVDIIEGRIWIRHQVDPRTGEEK